jgi:hypothetical protein
VPRLYYVSVSWEKGFILSQELSYITSTYSAMVPCVRPIFKRVKSVWRHYQVKFLRKQTIFHFVVLGPIFHRPSLISPSYLILACLSSSFAGVLPQKLYIDQYWIL